MKGYYVIPKNGDPIEFTGQRARKRAITKAKQLYLQGDSEVFIQHFDDDNPDGYFAGEEMIYAKDLIEEK